jgi:hypothetical protein
MFYRHCHRLDIEATRRIRRLRDKTPHRLNKLTFCRSLSYWSSVSPGARVTRDAGVIIEACRRVIGTRF